MRLIINAIPIAPGGGLSVLVGLLEGWRRINAAIEPVVLVGKSATLGILRDAIPTVRVEPLLLDQGPSKQLLWQLARLGPRLRGLRPDVLLSNNLYIPRAPCPQVVHHQDMLRFMHKRLWSYFTKVPPSKLAWQAVLARHSLTRANANVFISDFIRRAAESLVPACAGRNVTIYNGVYNEYLDVARAGTGVERDPWLLSTISGPQPHKDNETLLRAFAEICRREPHGRWRLQILGPSDWSRWQVFANQLGIGQNVQLLGYHDRMGVIRVLARSACLLFTSRVEGFGLPIIEAMACGCPVVASDVAAIPEVGGQAVVLARPGEPESFAQKVLEIVRDPARQEALSRAGRAWAGRFSWDRSARTFEECLHAVVEERPLPCSWTAKEEP
jgi:glycosyltransferase involved in cell wall biosynthesis